MGFVVECSKYVVYYAGTVVVVHVFATKDGYVSTSVDYPSFSLNYKLANDGSDEAYVRLHIILERIDADPNKVLDIIARIFGEGNILEEISCRGD